MRFPRLVLALAALGLLAPTAPAGQIYYAIGVSGGSDVFSAPDDGSAPTTRALPTVPLDVDWTTNRRHAQAGGYALLACRKDGEVTIGGKAYQVLNLVLVTKDRVTGNPTYRPVTNFSAAGPMYINLSSRNAQQLAQDDSFFSFRAEDPANSVEYLCRLNVTVDQVLDPSYVPPSDFNDPRLQLLIRHPYYWLTNSYGTTNNLSTFGHTWNQDGTRLAYGFAEFDATGRKVFTVRVKALTPGYDPSPANDTVLVVTNPTSGMVLDANWWRWSPVPGSDRLIGQQFIGGALISLYADSPGVSQVTAPILTSYPNKTTQVTESNEAPIWSPDGSMIAARYIRETSVKSKGVWNNTYFYSVDRMANTGWPAQILTGASITGNWSPIGWTP
jgi:hypothetical protein